MIQFKNIKFLEQIGGITSNKDFPVIFVYDIPIGTVKDLADWISSSREDSLGNALRRDQNSLMDEKKNTFRK